MQIQLNIKNCLIFAVVLFFLYLAYLLYIGDAASSSKLLMPSHISVNLKDVMSYCLLAVEIGGSAIVKVHNEKSYWKQLKSQASGYDEFLTKADIVSHQLITDVLKRAPGLNIISEEKSMLSSEQLEKYRENNYFTWQRHKALVQNFPDERYLLSDVTVWVDPLDATQEFSEDLLQYVTVMLCITVRGKAKFGAIYRPFYNETVLGLVGHGIHPEHYVADSSGSSLTGQKPKTIIVSRSHAGDVEKLARQALSPEKMHVEAAGGSGYKSLRLVNGTADLYVHVTKLKKWDVCAPDAIVRAAGGRVTDLDGAEFDYNVGLGGEDDDLYLKRGLFASLNQQHFHYLSKFGRSFLRRQTDDVQKENLLNHSIS